MSATEIESEPTSSVAPKLVLSDRFCASDADITFKSCDDILFKVHRKYLDAHSEGFGPPNGCTTVDEDEIVMLSETAQVLELVFQYMYPMRQPDLKKVDYITLVALSETVEKYQVFSAMEICKLRMEAQIPQHPFEVLSYAVKHGHADLVDMAAQTATGWYLSCAYKGLTPPVYVAWTRYYGLWMEVLDFAHHIGPLAHGDAVCDLWKRLYAETAARLGGNPGTLRNTQNVFRPCDATPILTISTGGEFQGISPGKKVNSGSSCTMCFRYIVEWRRHVEQKLQAIPKFSTFL